MSTLRLILGDQLNPCHSWFQTHDEQTIYVFIECRQETDYVLHHIQKIIAIFAGMRAFAKSLQERGHRVHYLTLDDPQNKQNLIDNLLFVAQQYGGDHIEYQEPDEWRLDQQLLLLAKNFQGSVRCVSSEHFYTQRAEGLQVFKGQWLMERFYRYMRRRHQVLMTQEQEPEGGQWNFDEDNRHPWKGQQAIPTPRWVEHDHSLIWQCLQQMGVKSIGQVDPTRVRWPIHRQEALDYLEDFIVQRLPYFGHYQDAMVMDEPFLFHSMLSFALNTKMLSPQEVVARAEEAYHQGLVSLSSVEGFIRQILGWREYVRVFYWAHSPEHGTSNFFHHERKVPEWFWTGKTKMNCAAQAISQSLTHAYAHHIQRLMIIGNLSLLMGLSPQEVGHWYLGIYIDAFEWVEEPNTLGMSQFADGGKLATKPYVSSAAYVNRMSNYCRHCHYDHRLRVGETACPLNALYWHFHNAQRSLLAKNPRLSLVYRQWDRFSAADQEAILKQAQSLLDNVNEC